MKQYNDSIKGKLYNYFKTRLNTKKSTKGWSRTDCIYCGGKFTFGLHIDKRKAHCFKCGEHKSPVELLMDIENFTTLQEAYRLLNLQEEYEQYDGRVSTGPIEYKELTLPESFTPILYESSIMGKLAQKYLKKRRFNIDKLARKGVGYCTAGEYEGYIIFPFYQKSKLVFFQGRTFLNNGPKMRNPPEEDFGIGKTQILYNADALYIYNKVYLVESITNAETLGDNAVASLGKVVSTWQLSQIISSPCSTVVIILDRDATKEAIGLAMQLVMYKRVKLVIPPGDDDVNDMGRKMTKALEKEFAYTNYQELFSLKLNINAPSFVAHN